MEHQNSMGEGKHPQDASSLLKRFKDDLTMKELEGPSEYKNLTYAGEPDDQVLRRKQHEAWRRYITDRGKRYEDCSLENYECESQEQTDAVARLASMFETNEVHSLILLGPAGTGKDHLLTGCVRKAVKAGVFSIGWTSGPGLFSALRSAISEKRKESDVLMPFMRCRILVVSDIAMTTLTDYQREILYKIVDHRYNDMLTTWVSSNIADRNAFVKATSEQIVDRIADGAVYLPCNWKSYRKTHRVEAGGVGKD